MWPRLISFFSSLWLIIFLELGNYQPGRLLLWGILAVAGPALTLGLWLRKIRKQKMPIYGLGLPPFYLLLGTFLLLIFLDRPLFRQFLIIFSGFLFYIDLFYLGLFAGQNRGYPVGGLEKINIALLGWTAFLLAASFFGWVTFVAQNLWPVLLAVSILFFPLFQEIFYLRKIEIKKSAVVCLILTLLAVEFFWALALWPIGFISKGLVWTILLLYFSYLCQAWLLNAFNRRRAWSYGLFAAFLEVAVLMTTRWI